MQCISPKEQWSASQFALRTLVHKVGRYTTARTAALSRLPSMAELWYCLAGLIGIHPWSDYLTLPPSVRRAKFLLPCDETVIVNIKYRGVGGLAMTLDYLTTCIRYELRHPNANNTITPTLTTYFRTTQTLLPFPGMATRMRKQTSNTSTDSYSSYMLDLAFVATLLACASRNLQHVSVSLQALVHPSS